MAWRARRAKSPPTAPSLPCGGTGLPSSPSSFPNATGCEGPIHLAEQRRIGWRNHEGETPPALHAVADHDVGARLNALALPQHCQGRIDKRPRPRERGDPCGRRNAPHHQASVIGAQLVGIERRLPHPPTGAEWRQCDRHCRPGGRERPGDLTIPDAQGHRPGTAVRRSDDAQGQGTIGDARDPDPAIRRRLALWCEGQDPHAPRRARPTGSQRRALQVAQHVDFTRRQRLTVDEPRRHAHGGGQVQSPRRNRDAVQRRQQRLPRSGPRHAIRQHEPESIGRRRASERGPRHPPQAIERGVPIHDEP